MGPLFGPMSDPSKNFDKLCLQIKGHIDHIRANFAVIRFVMHSSQFNTHALHTHTRTHTNAHAWYTHIHKYNFNINFHL